jgi:DNA-binding response OmpR family regulator
MTILVVESDPVVSRVVTRLLQLEGFRVITATGAREAVTLLRRSRDREPIALIAVEWEPPDMDGDEFLSCVDRVAPETPVLRMAPAADPLAGFETDRRADPAVASKPFRADELPRHVRAALGIPPRDGMERRRRRVPA